MDSAEEFTGSNDHTLIVKGKRTKRQRPSSTSTSSTSAAEAAGSGRDGVYFSIPSPISSAEISTNTEEDEDMANCLILLAQGVFPSQLEDEEEEEAEESKIGKFSRPRYTDTAVTTAGKNGCYIYECKTCDRTFPSFQALGGHRASHKRPKTAAEENRAIPATLPPPPPEEKEDGGIKFMKLISHINNKPKIHECSICGSEFSSGQALGGHMRRHRAAPNPRTTASIDPTTTVESGVERDDEKKKIFPLDLNLPAPIEEDPHREIKFQFFSGPTLVDCRY